MTPNEIAGTDWRTLICSECGKKPERKSEMLLEFSEDVLKAFCCTCYFKSKK